MLKKEIRIELIWILSMAVLTLILIGLLIGFEDWKSKAVDIQLHDTYYVLTIKHAFVFIFLNIGFWVYSIRQVINKFKKLPGNIVLLCITGLLIFIKTYTIPFLGTINEGWTVYPPLSAMSGPYTTTFEINPFFQFYQIFLITVLGFAGVMTGRGIERLMNQK